MTCVRCERCVLLSHLGPSHSTTDQLFASVPKGHNEERGIELLGLEGQGEMTVMSRTFRASLAPACLGAAMALMKRREIHLMCGTGIQGEGCQASPARDNLIPQSRVTLTLSSHPTIMI